jgi:hypothetical protein
VGSSSAIPVCRTKLKKQYKYKTKTIPTEKIKEIKEIELVQH